MPDSFVSRLKHGWDAFRNKDPTSLYSFRDLGAASSIRPDRTRFRVCSERSIVNSIYTRIAIDCSQIDIRHVRVDKNGRFLEEINSDLNYCLTKSANIDQTGRAFIQDVVMSLCDEGAIAIVPVDTTLNPLKTGAYDIQSLRVGKILEWFPRHVRVKVYNDKTGRHEELVLPKSVVAIVENPFYEVMNEPNSLLQRLIRKLGLMDSVDEQTSSGKLDLIIQLPYVIKSDTMRENADRRRKDIEMQLAGSKYGIAYTDGTERVTQLNRPAENNLLSQIEMLTTQVYGQLGMTKEIFEGTANEEQQLNYYNRTIEPFLAAICTSMDRTFLTKTAQTQGQEIAYFRDPFKLVPAKEISEIADKFTRNEILSSNEVRAIIGYRPDKDPRADELRNKNLSASNDQLMNTKVKDIERVDDSQNESEEEE